MVISYLALRLLPVLFSSRYETITAEGGVLEDSIPLKAIIIKNETVYKSEVQGNISLIKEEGEKIGKGIQIAKIHKSESSSYAKELEQIDKQIELMKKTSSNKELYKEDKEKVQSNIDAVIDELQNSILAGNYSDVLIYQNALLQNYGKQQLVSGQKNLVYQSLDSLTKKKNDIMKSMEQSSIINYSSRAGVISYKIDGLEEIFSANKINDYKVGDFRIIDEKLINLKENKEVNFGDPLYKIIDNYRWYAIMEVNTKDADKLEEGKTLNVRINDEERKLVGRILKLSEENDKCLIVMMFSDYFHEYYSERYVDIQIIKNTYEGLVVPNKSIAEKDGVKGVYIKDISGIVKFRPIKILTSNHEHTIVSEGEGFNRIIELDIDGDKQKFSTIQIFDEVFANGSKIKEGLIVN